MAQRADTTYDGKSITAGVKKEKLLERLKMPNSCEAKRKITPDRVKSLREGVQVASSGPGSWASLLQLGLNYDSLLSWS